MSVRDVTTQDAADDLVLAALFQRQDELESLTNAIAEMVYLARAKWIGGMCLPWGVLTAGQRQQYRDEVARLIRERE